MPIPPPLQNGSNNIYNHIAMTMFLHGSLHWTVAAIVNPSSILKEAAGGPPELKLAKRRPFILFLDSMSGGSHNPEWLKDDLVSVLVRNFRQHHPQLIESSPFRMEM